MIESRAGKHALITVLLILAAVLATVRPKKLRYVYPVARREAAAMLTAPYR